MPGGRTATLGILVQPEVRAALEGLAVEQDASLSTVAADLLADAVGAERAPRPEREFDLDRAAEFLGLKRETARSHVKTAVRRGVLTERKDGHSKLWRSATWGNK
jgi:hypothetical protein